MRYVALVLLAAYMLVSPVRAESLPETARTGKSEQMEQILELRADVNQRGRQNETALHWMAFHGNEAMVRKLITAGADVNVRASNGSTPLHLAAYKGHIDVARLLVAGQAGVDVRNRDGITPLDWALRNGNREVAEFLIGNGAKTGSSQAATATTARHSDRKLQDLKHFSRLKPVLARQQPQRPAALAEPQSINVHDPQAHPQTGVYRIQLAAVGTHERALKPVFPPVPRYPGRQGTVRGACSCERKNPLQGSGRKLHETHRLICLQTADGRQSALPGDQCRSLVAGGTGETGTSLVSACRCIHSSCRSGASPRIAPGRRSCSKLFCTDWTKSLACQQVYASGDQLAPSFSRDFPEHR